MGKVSILQETQAKVCSTQTQPVDNAACTSPESCLDGTVKVKEKWKHPLQ